MAVAGDKSAMVKSAMIFYKPTGPLSGVTTVAILIWLACWGLLEWRWRERSVAVGRVCLVAGVLLGVGVLLTVSGGGGFVLTAGRYVPGGSPTLGCLAIA